MKMGKNSVGCGQRQVTLAMEMRLPVFAISDKNLLNARIARLMSFLMKKQGNVREYKSKDYNMMTQLWILTS